MTRQQLLSKLTLRQTLLLKTRHSSSFVKAVAEQAVESDAADMDAFMEEKWNEDPSKTVKDALVEKVAVIGENLKIRRFEKLLLQTSVLYRYHTRWR